MVPQHDNLPASFRRHPVELDDPALADEGFVPVPGIVGALEREHRSLGRRHFDDDIVEIVARSQETQASPGLFPGRIHVDQHGDDLAHRVGVDLSVAGAALAADRRRGGATGELKTKFLLEGCAELVAFQVVEQGLEGGTEIDLAGRKAAPLGDLGIVGVDARRAPPNRQSRRQSGAGTAPAPAAYRGRRQVADNPAFFALFSTEKAN